MHENIVNGRPSEDTQQAKPVSESKSSADVKIYGDLIEFRAQRSCEACIARNRRCLWQHGEQSCELCRDADRECIFERKVRVRGPPHKFWWDVLVDLEPTLDADKIIEQVSSCNP